VAIARGGTTATAAAFGVEGCLDGSADAAGGGARSASTDIDCARAGATKTNTRTAPSTAHVRKEELSRRTPSYPRLLIGGQVLYA